MAAKTVDKLIRELDCAICTKNLKNPKSLSCGHSFCEECLKQYDNTSEVRSGDIKCHMCREITILSKEGVAGLKSNPLICRVLEVLEAKKNSAQIMCDACGASESPLTTYCRDCLRFICDSCASSHAKMKVLMKDHRTVPLDQIENGTITIKWMEECLWGKAHECEKHSGELRRFYCMTCKTSICRECAVLDHSKPDHDCIPVEKMFHERQEKVKDRLKSCKEKEKHVSTMLNDVDVRETGANQKLSLPHVWRETQMFPIPDKNIVNIFSDGNSMYVACKKGIYKKLLPHDANPSTWMKLHHYASIKQVVDMAISMKDQTFSFIAENEAACTQLFRLKLDDFPTSHRHATPSSSVLTVTPCPLNHRARISVDSQSRIVVADNNPSPTTDPAPAPFGFKPAQAAKSSPPGGLSFGQKLPQQPKVTSACSSQTASAGTINFGRGNTENKRSSAASNGKEGETELGLAIPKPSTTIYRGKPGKILSPSTQCDSVLSLGSPQLSSDSFKVPFDRVRSLAAAKTGQLVFLRWDKKAVVITDKDGRIQHEIKEPCRMYLSISCTESDALYVLSAFWGSHIVTLTKHSLEDGGLLEYIIDELDLSANSQQSHEWPVIGNHGNDLMVINIGDEIRVYRAEDWDWDSDDQDED